jgi:hypothetical protein
MPKKKVRVTELPDKEAIRKLFPKEVVEYAEKVAHEKDSPDDAPDKSPRR